MKKIFSSVIERGGYDLTAILDKIDKYHIEGKLTNEERDELYSLARKEPKAQYNYDTEIEKLWDAVRSLQNGETTGGDTNTVSDWKQPTGAHDAYMSGDIIKYTNGKTYKSVIDNNVWSPDAYPNGWEEV